MKLTIPRTPAALAAILASSMVNTVSANCATLTFPVTITGTTCNKATLLDNGITAACLTEVYGEEVDAGVAELCSSLELPFGEISHQYQNYQFDKNYFDGGTEWNDLMETDPTTKITAMAGRIKRVKENAASNARFAWPKYDAVNDAQDLVEGEYDPTGYMTNFHLEESCQLRAVMCCFVASRADGAEGNTDNADVCYHDIRNSYKSAHVRRGWEVFPEDETTTTCVGFAWDADESSDSAMYKGNALFQASFMKTFEDKLVKGIPGAPMCACIEQMPVVTDASCVSVKVEGDDAINVTLSNGSLEASLASNVIYGDCDGKSLKEHYASLSTPAEQAELSKHIVDSCETATAQWLNNRFYVQGPTRSFDVEGWTNVVGERSLYYPQIGETEFRKLIEKKDANGKYPLVWRQCDSCWSYEHKNIYYRRVSDWCAPNQLDALELFMNEWRDDCNSLEAGDFKLYHTLDDAINDTNAWTFCNYNDSGIGFPRDCGPTQAVDNMWNSYDPRRNHGGAQHHIFRVQNV